MPLKLQGRVVKLVTNKGFGFIEGTDGVQYFFHRSAAPAFDTLTAGELVSFVSAPSLKGDRAESVARLE